MYGRGHSEELIGAFLADLGPARRQELSAERAAAGEAGSEMPKELAAVVEDFDGAVGGPVYRMHCPMAFNNRGADWLKIKPTHSLDLVVLAAGADLDRLVEALGESEDLEDGTETAQKVLEMENQGATLDELIVYISGKVGLQAWTSGDLDGATIACGQNVGLIHEVLTVKQVIDGIVSGAREIAARLNSIVE